MKKKFIGFLLAAAAVCTTAVFPVCAEEELLYEDLNYTVQDDGTITITNCLQNAISCEVPSEIDGKPVTAIAASAFAECYFLEEVALPDSVTSIGQQAFSACSVLQKISLPHTLEMLGAGVFDSCPELKEVTIPAGFDALPQAAFYECTGLEKVTLPEGIVSIGSEAFYNCTALKELVLPQSTETIADYAFQGCSTLTEIAFPQNVVNLGAYIFQDCKALTHITAADENTAFQDKDGVLFTKNGDILVRYPEARTASTYTVPEGCSKLANGSFVDAVNLISIDLNQATVYGQDAFFRCSGLESLTLPEGVTDLSGSVFAYCSGLKNVSLPSTLKVIGDYAFYTCTGIEEMSIPDGTQKIGAYSFFNCLELKTLHLPDSITEIGDGALGYYAETEDTEPQKIDGFILDYQSNDVIHDYAVLYGLEGSGSGAFPWAIVLGCVGGGIILIGGIVLAIVMHKRAYTIKPVPGGRQGSASKKPAANQKGKSE